MPANQTDQSYPSSPVIKQRPQNSAILQQAQALGLSPLLAKVLAGRLADGVHNLDGIVQPALRYIERPEKLKDAGKAAQRIAQAVMQGQTIGVLTDYDVDGITSHAVMYRALTELFHHPADKIQSLIGHRLQDGYGVSAGLVARILQLPVLPDVIITADCGSSDEARIVLLKQAGIDVIVTDHHALPVEGPPESAFAMVNPTQSDCSYPDVTIAGCMVAWLVMSAVRMELVAQAYLPEKSPKLGFLLSYVALGTVADCVSLGDSAINRAVVKNGLDLINRFDQPCWRAVRKLLKKEDQLFSADVLGYQLGPRINARGRLDDPYAALHFILAPSDHQAEQYLAILDQDNEDRKAIEQEMTLSANQLAQQQVAQGLEALSIYLPEGHPGVQGIVASRVTQKTGKPSVVLCPAVNPEHMTGSARSVDQVHIRDALQWVHDNNPEIMVKFGGHRGAAGLTIQREYYPVFLQAFDQAVKQQTGQESLQPVIWVDGELESEQINEQTWHELQALQPYGREFDSACFEGVFLVEQLKVIGADQSHLQLLLSDQQQKYSFRGIWFKALAGGQVLNFSEGDYIHCVYQLNLNHFRGRSQIQLMVEWAGKSGQ